MRGTQRHGQRLVGTAALMMILAATPSQLRGQDSGENGATGRSAGRVTPSAGTAGHETSAPSLVAARVEAGQIELDGRLDEAAWQNAPAATDFQQWEPDEGQPATQRTEVRFLFTGQELYVGARMYDDLGAEGVVSRLVRRDQQANSDELVLTLDTYHDHLGQAQFRVNPAGVRGDALDFDNSWDPIWRVRTSIDSLGWVAELEIPFSQLRFPPDQELEWGVQITRFVQRLNERSGWSFWNLNQGGGPSRYGHLTGIAAPQASINRLELLPYVVSQVDVTRTLSDGNPFRDVTEPTARVGGDLKYLLSSNLTLTATINPDFGQAEVDPAVVNLSAFETFFPEKREFFIEGRNRFSFGNFWCKFCSNTSSLGMLFTRRIGRSPQAAFLASGGEFRDIPTNSTILGAAKVTGRTPGGTSIGILSALTQRESARIATGTDIVEQEVEPAAGFFVGRVKQDLMDGDLEIGGIFTSVLRDFDDPALESVLNKHAQGVGLDAEYWWGDRTYHLMFQTAFTNISGDSAAILSAQRASARYLQRPDREAGDNGLFTSSLDPSLTSMRGWGLYTRMAKDAGDLQWEATANIRSPGFENNDLAFLSRADYLQFIGNVQRGWTVPTSWYRSLYATVGGQQEFAFDGDRTGRQIHASVFTETPFYWNLGSFVIRRMSEVSHRETRGGPRVGTPASTSWFANVSTDSRKPIVFGFFPNYTWDEEGGSQYSFSGEVSIKPASNVNLSFNPSFSRRQSEAQYVTRVDDPTAVPFFGRRYVFADLDQKTLSMTTRLNYTFTPSMTLELFLQPLISANDFGSFKEFARPGGLEKLVYGEDIGTVRNEGDGFEERFFIDPDGAGPAEEFSVSDPDFNFRSLRGNLVFRWEYMPGSTLFFVWTQARSDVDPFGDFSFGRDRGALFDAPDDNVFLIKLTYWLGL